MNKHKYCSDCGHKKVLNHVKTSRFNENTGKQIYKDIQICMNKSCIGGKIERQDYLCPHVQEGGSHKFSWFFGKCICGDELEDY